MAEIECESWETGKPFLGIPSKFVVVNEDGENIGTLADLLPLLMYAANNLADLDDAEESRSNLDVYSKSEVDELPLPDATLLSKGAVFLSTDQELMAGTNETKAITPKNLKDYTREKLFGNAGYIANYEGYKFLDTVYTNSRDQPTMLFISATMAVSGSYIQLRGINNSVRASSNSAPAAGQVFLTYLLSPNEEYKISQVGSGAITINKWTEK